MTAYTLANQIRVSNERPVKYKVKKNQKHKKEKGNLADSRELLSHQLVRIAVEHNVDMTLQAYPDVIEFVCKSDSRQPQ